MPCKICGQIFYAKPCWIKKGNGKYCSRKCSYEAQLKGKLAVCEVCGKEIWRKPHEFRNSKSGKFFCNKSCQAIWRNQTYVGPRHPFWKGGNFQEYRKILIKSSAKMECKHCGCKDIRVLVAHHLDGRRINNSLQNLIWLCFNCHFLVHRHKESV